MGDEGNLGSMEAAKSAFALWGQREIQYGAVLA